MAEPKFKMGDRVTFIHASHARSRGEYEIVRVLPSEKEDERHYRVRSALEPYERMVAEHELQTVGGVD